MRVNGKRYKHVSSVFAVIVLLLLIFIPLSSSSASAVEPSYYDYKVSSNVVKNFNGASIYTAPSFTSALVWATSRVGKITYVPTGTYSVTSSIYIKSGVTLIGDGPDATILKFTTANKNSARMCLNGVNNVILKGFQVTGYGNIEIWCYGITCGNHLLQDIKFYKTSSIQPACFMTWVANKGTIDGLKLIRCQAIEPGCMGFALMGDRSNVDTVRTTGGWVKNVYFEDCKAYKCGISSRFNTWVCGYDLAEGVNVMNVRLLRCSATYSWMDGFHFEKWPYVKSVSFEKCTASYNGIKGYGYGYIYNLAMSHQVSLSYSSGTANKSGLIKS